MPRLSYREAANDSGLLREYVARHYGQVFTFGATPERYLSALRLVKRLAKMTGLEVSAVIASVRSDAEILFDGSALRG